MRNGAILSESLQKRAEDLRWFFAQWVEQDGAPVLSLPEVVARPVAGEPRRSFSLRPRSSNRTSPFVFPFSLLIHMEGDREHMSDCAAAFAARDDLRDLARATDLIDIGSRVHDLPTDRPAIVVAGA